MAKKTRPEDLIFTGKDLFTPQPTNEIDRILGIEQKANGPGKKDAPIPIRENIKHARRAAKNEYRNTIRVNNAIEALGGLPKKGWTVHQIMNATYDSFDFVPAILHYAPSKQRIEDLYLASLGFNAKNALALLDLLDRGRIGRASMLLSVYYEHSYNERDVCQGLAAELPKYGGFYHASRSHAKLILARMTDGTSYAIESSANLRGCRCLEQFTITNDPGLFDFHASWIRGVYEEETANKKAAAAPAAKR